MCQASLFTSSLCPFLTFCLVHLFHLLISPCPFKLVSLSYCSLCCHAYLFCITILVLFLLCSLCSQCSFGLYLFVLGLNVLDFLFFLFDCFLCFFSFCCQPFVDFLLYLFFGFCVWTLALLLKLTFFVFINLPASSCIVQLSMSKFLDVSANSAAAELLDASLFLLS